MSATRVKRQKPFYANLTVQVLVAIVIGILLGYFRPSLGIEMKPLGDVFVRLIKMVIGPIVFLTVVAGIAQAGDMRKVGRIGVKALVYFEVVTTICLLIGIVVAHLIHPGTGIALPHVQASDLAQFTKPQSTSMIDFLVHVVPDNAVAAFATGDVLQVLIFAVLFGAGLVAVGEPGLPLAHELERLSATLFRVIAIVMRVAPIGAFGAMAFTIGRFGLAALLPLRDVDAGGLHHHGIVRGVRSGGDRARRRGSRSSPCYAPSATNCCWCWARRRPRRCCRS